MFSFDLQGLPQLQRQLQVLTQQVETAFTQALQAEADRILEASYPFVPVETGALISSGTVIKQPEGADIRYGNFGAVPYAIRQHEDTTLSHPNGGEHHFLSKPLFEATGDMAQRLAADVAPHLKR